MVSAFRGLNEVVQLRQGTGVIMDWKQSAGILLVGGDSRVIKVWDAQTETQGLVRTTFFFSNNEVSTYFRTSKPTQRVLSHP